jgi:Mn-containing catalase
LFAHTQRLQHEAKPDKPDHIYARKLQELIGGQYGEISVAMQYMFQGWNMKLPGKYRDMVFGIGAEEIGHVEMLATMVARLLENTPMKDTMEHAISDPAVAAVVGGMDVQHAIVAGAGARIVDSNGNPWQGAFITASGNLMADFHANVNAEMQGRVQAARMYHMTDDKGVHDLLKFLIARDTMHQNQWLAAIEELKADGLEELPVPSNFPQSQEDTSVNYTYFNFSDGTHASEGRWASGPTPDGNGEFSYAEGPTEGVEFGPAPAGDERLYGTTAKPNVVEKIASTVKDTLHKP